MKKKIKPNLASNFARMTQAPGTCRDIQYPTETSMVEEQTYRNCNSQAFATGHRLLSFIFQQMQDILQKPIGQELYANPRESLQGKKLVYLPVPSGPITLGRVLQTQQDHKQCEVDLLYLAKEPLKPAFYLGQLIPCPSSLE